MAAAMWSTRTIADCGPTSASWARAPLRVAAARASVRRSTSAASSGLSVTSTAGLLVVLGLAHEVGGDEVGIRGGVRDDEDLGGTGLGIRPHHPGDHTLGGGDEVVARARHDVHRVQVEAVDAVGERPDRAGTAHRVHLGDAEESRSGEDHRVDASAVLALRR